MSLQYRVTRLDNARYHGGPRDMADVRYFIVHKTASDKTSTAQGIISWMNSHLRAREKPPRKVSYHYVVDRDGSIWRMLAPENIAYACGDSAWPNPVVWTPSNPKPNGGRSLNRISISAAFVNDNVGEKVTPKALESMEWLAHFWINDRRVNIRGPSAVLGHYEISPGRKFDPRTLPMEDFRALLTDSVG